jgi:predicted dehydrogenase
MKFGILGYGSIGRRHANNLNALGHELLIYDSAETSPKVTREGVIYSSDAILICTPTERHFDDLMAVPFDKPVFIEKPIATPGRQLAVRDILGRRSAPTMVGCNLRFHPAVRRAREWLPEIGKPLWAFFSVSGPGQRKYYNDGVLLNSGAHEIDLVQHILGPATVKACVATRKIANVILDQNNIKTTVHLDWVTEARMRGFNIIGKNAHVIIDIEKRTANLWTEAHATFRKWNSTIDDDYVDEMKAFVRGINGDSFLPGATGEDGLATLKLIADAQRMAE